MKNESQNNRLRSGFSLIELMIVIAIIGILTSVVTVSMKSSIEKSKKASATTTASSVLPELVTCGDDGGFVRTAVKADDAICVTSSSNSTALDGHNAKWPKITDKTGWNYSASSNPGTVIDGNFEFHLKKDSESVYCSMENNGCE